MRITLDASYSLGLELSGVGVYSRQLIAHLTAAHPDGAFRLAYRPHRILAGLRDDLAPGASRALLTESGPWPGADLFHGLNQRLPHRRLKRSLATFHDLFVLTGEFSTPEFRERFAEQARHAAERADMILAVSEFTASQVEDLLGVPRSRIRVVPHGATPSAVPPAPVAREPLILFLGALQKRKNLVRLIDAFETVPPGWRLMLVGGRGFGIEEIDERIARSSRRSEIFVVGYLPPVELEKAWARAGIFAFPSLDEGFGMPVLDAMLRGVPVITSNRSAMPEVAGDAACMVDPERVDEIAAALTILCANPSKREELSALGRVRATQFGWPATAENTWRIYMELLA